MSKKTIGGSSTAPVTPETAREFSLSIPVCGLHAPAWADGNAHSDEGFEPDWYNPTLPAGVYKAELGGVREMVSGTFFRTIEWIFIVTERIEPKPDTLPWGVLALGHTGLTYGPAQSDLTAWVGGAVGHPVDPYALEGTGLAAFVSQQFQVTINDAGRVEYCRLVPDGTTIDEWWQNATKRYREGEYCRAWHVEKFKRRAKLIVRDWDWLNDLALETAGGRTWPLKEYEPALSTLSISSFDDAPIEN